MESTPVWDAAADLLLHFSLEDTFWWLSIVLLTTSTATFAYGIHKQPAHVSVITQIGLLVATGLRWVDYEVWGFVFGRTSDEIFGILPLQVGVLLGVGGLQLVNLVRISSCCCGRHKGTENIEGNICKWMVLYGVSLVLVFLCADVVTQELGFMLRFLIEPLFFWPQMNFYYQKVRLHAAVESAIVLQALQQFLYFCIPLYDANALTGLFLFGVVAWDIFILFTIVPNLMGDLGMTRMAVVCLVLFLLHAMFGLYVVEGYDQLVSDLLAIWSHP